MTRVFAALDIAAGLVIGAAAFVLLVARPVFRHLREAQS